MQFTRPHGQAVQGYLSEADDAVGSLAGTASHDTGSALNEKEARVLRLVAEGMTNKQIAGIVFLAEGTVKNYVSRIMEKLHAGSRTQLAVMAVRQRRVE